MGLGPVAKLRDRKPTFVRSVSKSVLVPMALALCYAAASRAQTADSQNSDSSKSWTATTEFHEDNENPTQTTQTHVQNGDRTVDVQSVQTRGHDGTMSPYEEIETETTRLGATKTRTITRTFVRDSNGAKALSQIAQEDKETLPGGGSKVVRTTSDPDANGTLQVVQRDVQETAITGSGRQDISTTTMLPGIDGTLVPTMQSHEVQQRNGNNVEIQKTTLLPDGSGNWQVGEVKHETINDDGKNRSRQEDISRPDSEGNLDAISRTISRKTESAAGNKKNEEDIYSVDVPGSTRDGSLHETQRTTTTQHTDTNGQQTTQVSEAPSPGNPASGMQITTVTNDTVRLRPSGAQATRTIQLSDANKNLGVVFVDTAKSDNAHAVEVQIGPPQPK
jgi:hypothetical protein